MQSYGPMSILCMLIMSAGIACAPPLVGPTTPSGYLFRLQVSDHQLWLERNRDSLVYPSVATLVVHVQDSQGRDVDNIPVSFNISNNGTQDTLLTPMQTTTQGGAGYCPLSAHHYRGILRHCTGRTTRTTSRHLRQSARHMLFLSSVAAGARLCSRSIVENGEWAEEV